MRCHDLNDLEATISSKVWLGLVFALSCMLVSVVHAESGKLREKGSLYVEAASTSATAGSVDAGVTVELLERKGFWVKLKAPAVTGWTKISNVAVEQGSGGGTGLTALASGRSGANNSSSTAGGRGLGGDEIKAAAPNRAALESLGKLAVGSDEAAQFAREAGLQSKDVTYVPAADAKSAKSSKSKT